MTHFSRIEDYNFTQLLSKSVNKRFFDRITILTMRKVRSTYKATLRNA